MGYLSVGAITGGRTVVCADKIVVCLINRNYLLYCREKVSANPERDTTRTAGKTVGTVPVT